MFIFYLFYTQISSTGGGGEAQRPLSPVNRPKKTGARSARARTRGQNSLVTNIWHCRAGTSCKYYGDFAFYIWSIGNCQACIFGAGLEVVKGFNSYLLLISRQANRETWQNGRASVCMLCLLNKQKGQERQADARLEENKNVKNKK
jgi:hypothetical protein